MRRSYSAPACSVARGIAGRGGSCRVAASNRVGYGGVEWKTGGETCGMPYPMTHRHSSVHYLIVSIPSTIFVHNSGDDKIDDDSVSFDAKL